MVVAITSRLACGLILVLTCSGCVVGRAMQDWVVHVEQVANQKELAAEERRLAKRDYLAARVDLYKDHRSQLQFDREAANYDRQAQQALREEAIRDARREKVRTEIGLDFDHRIRVGQIQVDVDKLQKVLEARKKQREKVEEALTEINDERIRQNTDFYIRQATEALRENNLPAARQAILDCQTACNCASPSEEPLLGSNEEPLESVGEPLLPTEIPLMLPVTFTLEQNEAALQGTRIVGRPLPEEEPLTDKPCVEPACAADPTKGTARVFLPKALRQASRQPPAPPVE